MTENIHSYINWLHFYLLWICVVCWTQVLVRRNTYGEIAKSERQNNEEEKQMQNYPNATENHIILGSKWSVPLMMLLRGWDSIISSFVPSSCNITTQIAYYGDTEKNTDNLLWLYFTNCQKPYFCSSQFHKNPNHFSIKVFILNIHWAGIKCSLYLKVKFCKWPSPRKIHKIQNYIIGFWNSSFIIQHIQPTQWNECLQGNLKVIFDISAL